MNRNTNDIRAEGDHQIDDSPQAPRVAARQRDKRLATTSESQPGSIAALADATDRAIGSIPPKAKLVSSKNVKVPKATASAKAANKKFSQEKPTKATAPKKVVNERGLKALSELPKLNAPSTEPTEMAQSVAAPAVDAPAKTSKPAKVDWIAAGFDRTGELTVEALAHGYIHHLDVMGKTTASTMASYTNDLKAAIAFFGAPTTVATITPERVAKFNNCDLVMKLKSGKPKAMPTILKMRRVLRMAIEWARENAVAAFDRPSFAPSSGR